MEDKYNTLFEIANKHKLTIVFLLLLIVISLFVYNFNLKELTWFEGDSARDTLRSLEILRNRELTLIGPPLSFGQYGVREVYFGSLVYYFGAFGLWLFGENALGPIYIQIVIMLFSIPFFYLLTSKIFKNAFVRLVATTFYAVGPISVVHSRFFWNPNFIIPLSVFLWFFLKLGLENNNKKIKYLSFAISGLVGGAIINLHYTMALPVLAIIFYLLVSKKKEISFFTLGLFLSLSPLIIFELKNSFYLTNALVFNLQNYKSNINFLAYFGKLIELGYFFPVIMGLYQEFPFDIRSIVLPHNLVLITGTLCALMYFYVIFRLNTKYIREMAILVLVAVLASALLSKDNYSIRYMYVAYPIVIITFFKFLSTSFEKKTYGTVLAALFLFISLFSTYKIVTKQTIVTISKYRMPSIEDLENASKIISGDYSGRNFNITENITGDSRATYLRYFVYRDIPNNRLKGVTEYGALESLYVITPSKELTERERRWEFVATTNLKLVKKWQIKEYVLLRYDPIK